MGRAPWTLAVIAFLTAAIPAASPAPAAAAALGHPKMEVLTAKILPPYTSEWNLSTAISSWPPIGDVTFLREDSINASGVVFVKKTFNSSTQLKNTGSAMANEHRTFLSWAETKDPFAYANHVGVLSYTQWSQSFRKDSTDALFAFTIQGARVYAMCLTTGSRAEFAADAKAYVGNTEFYSFHQDAGVRLLGHPPGVPIVYVTANGPMTYTESNPDGIQRDHELVFGNRTLEIDLTSVPLHSEFTLVFDEMTQSSVHFDEVVKAFAYFKDPLDDTIGVLFETRGLTPTDHPVIPNVAVETGGPLGTARLSGARPNPARGAVTFTLELPAAGELRADVFDLSGRHVARLANGPYPAGTHLLTWQPREGREGGDPAGVYFVRATAPGLDVTRRVVRLGAR